MKRSDPYRPVIINSINVHPVPIITPGTLYVSLSGNLTYDLPRRISIQLEVRKYFIGIPTYENICANLETYEKRSRCPRRLRPFNVQCYCPFKAGVFNIKDLAVNIPKIGGHAGAFIKGEYKVKFRILDENRDELGCLELNFSMKRRHRGWLFKI
ncbi:hypothetical protein KUTeg_024045 [Tegillarca granosa]|uniref:MD-2-related lipid-recognition domain-containing protein n=1 Tax=Tegillarca granosa TaxID=220873 RepID=A0ABQ9DW74_TEGGR|nr:hypothetical protein KUTeg_024045 [Tegillarca granosa]